MQFCLLWFRLRKPSLLSLFRLLITDETVTIVQDGEEKEISTQLLKAGDIVIVRAGSVIPVDGTVVDGVGMVNQASMTGEALPVQREKGSSVFASTIFEEGEIKIKVKAAAETVLACRNLCFAKNLE